MHEMQRCLDLRRRDIDPEVYAAASAVRHVGTLLANEGSVYGQSDLVDAFHPSESEAVSTRTMETAQKSTGFLSEWHMSWRMLIEE
jgi:hypothetical protein